MIQRIQTIFLFLAIIALGIFNVFPYWQAIGLEEGVSHMLLSYGLASTIDSESSIAFGLYSIVAGLSAVSIIILLIEIFKYKDRGIQMKLAIANSFLMTVNLVLMIYFVMALQKDYQGGLGIGIFTYALAMLLNILARRFIQKDEKLVRSVDRLR